MNQVVLVGRLTKDPELNVKEEGKTLSVITLAVQRPYKNADGIYETDFIRCILFNAIAENTVEYCKCGNVVGIKGRIQSNNYEDKEGNKKYSLEVLVDRVTFLSSKQA